MRDAETLAEMVADTSIESDIEDAQAAGDDERAQALYLKSQDVAEPGDEDAAEQGDAIEPAPDIGPPPDGAWTFDRPEVVAHQFSIMESHFGDLATDLREEWGADAGRNLEFAAATAREFEAHYPEIIQTINNRGAGDDPLIVELLAVLGRQWAETPGDPRTVRLFPGTGDHEQETNMSDADNFDEQTDALMTEQEQAQTEGNLGKVDRLEREIRARFVRKYGTGAAVGSSGGPTA